MDRKKFIKQSTMVGVGLQMMPFNVLKGNLLPENKVARSESNPSTKKKIIVAGAGIAGLCCAYELMRLGHEVVILEAQGRYGGTVLSVRDGLSDGLYADYGAEQIHKGGWKKIWEYAEEFNLTVLPYPHRINRLSRIDNKWHTPKMALERRADRARELGGFNERELKYLSLNPLLDLESFYLDPYLEKFTDDYQPFGIGYDHLDTIPLSEIYKKEGASQAALDLLGGTRTSALFGMWRAYILKTRGIPNQSYDHTRIESYRFKGGNEVLPIAFAQRLGTRVKLDCQILEIQHGRTGITVMYREFGENKKMSADFLANCLPVTALRNIPVTPELPAEKRYVIDNVAYMQQTRIVFQARSKFWLKDNLSINMQFNHPDLRVIWQVAEEVDTERVALMAKATGGINPLRSLEAFKQLYPGDRSNITIEQTLVKDWSSDRFAQGCERLPFPMGTLSKFWPYVMTPVGRIHFAGGYTDNNSWGMEAATNSANRVAREIDQS